jgi:hypothetical protein
VGGGDSTQDVAVGNSFGKDENVGNDSFVIDGKIFSRSAKASLHFI